VRFLIDADLPRSTKTLLEKFGHQATDVRDIGLGSAKDPVIARYAQNHQACLLTGDFGFADIRNYPPEPTMALSCSACPAMLPQPLSFS
jgi:predicted nuclease of predicted toxin-antitoxin system